MTGFLQRLNKEKAAKRDRPIGSLNELLVDTGSADSANLPDGEAVLELHPNMFYVAPQVRTVIDPQEIEERAASMKANGQFQAISVHPMTQEGPNKGRYLIDKGECRWRAAQLIPDFLLKAVVDPEAPHRSLRKRIVGQLGENIQRADLRPLEIAEAIDTLIKDGMTQEDVAREIGWVTSGGGVNINKVSRHHQILKLPEVGLSLVRDRVVTDLITLEYLRKIYQSNPSRFQALCDLAREDNGITRKRAEQEYRNCRSSDLQIGDNEPPQTSMHESASTHSPDSNTNTINQTSSTPQPERKVGNEENKNEPTQTDIASPPIAKIGTNVTITVEWKGMRTGTLLLDRACDNGQAWIRLDTGDVILAEVSSELVLKSIKIIQN